MAIRIKVSESLGGEFLHVADAYPIAGRELPDVERGEGGVRNGEERTNGGDAGNTRTGADILPCVPGESGRATACVFEPGGWRILESVRSAAGPHGRVGCGELAESAPRVHD